MPVEIEPTTSANPVCCSANSVMPAVLSLPLPLYGCVYVCTRNLTSRVSANAALTMVANMEQQALCVRISARSTLGLVGSNSPLTRAAQRKKEGWKEHRCVAIFFLFVIFCAILNSKKVTEQPNQGPCSEHCEKNSGNQVSPHLSSISLPLILLKGQCTKKPGSLLREEAASPGRTE